MQDLKSVFGDRNLIFAQMKQKAKYVKNDNQDLALQIAEKLNDMAHRGIYMRMAKARPHADMYSALSYAMDYPLKHGTKAQIFMWRMKEIKKEREKKQIEDQLKNSSVN